MAFEDCFDEGMYRIQNTPAVGGIQLQKLRQHLVKFCEQSPLVTMFVDSQGVEPEEITLEDFQKAFPFLGQGTLRGSMSSEGAKAVRR